MMKMNKDYWEDRYLQNKTGWDLSEVSVPIKTYIDQIEDKTLKLLIPGAGNSYEAEYLWHKGFKNIFVLDIAKQPLQNFKTRVPEFPENQLLEYNFFELESKYDLIIEQTFFCALDPKLRQAYCQKVFDLLVPGGKIAGLLFDFELTASGPPFGGNVSLYKTLFSHYFEIKTLERSYNSMDARANKELFFIFEKNDRIE